MDSTKCCHCTPSSVTEQDIKARFGEKYGPSIHSAPAFSMNAEFAPVLQRQMDAFNNNPPGDSLQVECGKEGSFELVSFSM